MALSRSSFIPVNERAVFSWIKGRIVRPFYWLPRTILSLLLPGSLRSSTLQIESAKHFLEIRPQKEEDDKGRAAALPMKSVKSQSLSFLRIFVVIVEQPVSPPAKTTYSSNCYPTWIVFTAIRFFLFGAEISSDLYLFRSCFYLAQRQRQTLTLSRIPSFRSSCFYSCFPLTEFASFSILSWKEKKALCAKRASRLQEKSIHLLLEVFVTEKQLKTNRKRGSKVSRWNLFAFMKCEITKGNWCFIISRKNTRTSLRVIERIDRMEFSFVVALKSVASSKKHRHDLNSWVEQPVQSPAWPCQKWFTGQSFVCCFQVQLHNLRLHKKPTDCFVFNNSWSQGGKTEMSSEWKGASCIWNFFSCICCPILLVSSGMTHPDSQCDAHRTTETDEHHETASRVISQGESDIWFLATLWLLQTQNSRMTKWKSRISCNRILKDFPPTVLHDLKRC